ncbi:TPA: hypothetical protein ACSP83_000062 [Aeromonas veronii]
MTDMISAADCSAAVYEASSSMFLVDVALGAAFGFVLCFALVYGLWSFLYTRSRRYAVMRRHIQTFREWRRELELREQAIEAREKEAGI